MAGLINANPNLTDEQLYQAAVRAHPDLGNEVIEQAKREAEKAAQEQAAEDARARKAQAASKSISGTPDYDTSLKGVDPNDLRGTLKAVYDASMEGPRV